ncbi:hypothetical protein BJX68DRAFT_249637 [Aspergillus pseudodeflectus]|uniref:Zn(2)-C6 fungal-type domain-containing protein n=1 Tax=Aspergillus pseudodeflectus TaxID=176178 RepID=A0ABR4JC28_9EURO
MLPCNPTVPSQHYTAEACFACKTKKRKCDKQFPACSRCRRVDQECLYGIAADGVYGKIVPVTDKGPGRASPYHPSLSLEKPSPPTSEWGSCRRCNRLKKQCDKALPSCSRCTRLGAVCVYDRLQRRRLLSSQHVFSLDAPSLSLVPLRLSYPVESKSYIPSLVHSFQERMGLSTLVVETDSLAHHLRSSWIRHAMVDPCLMHATLYAASAHLDTLRDTAAGSPVVNSITLYHQTETIAAVNKRVSSGNVLDDATIASVLLLVITGSLQKDNGATEAHRHGLLHMVSMRGGLEKLGFDGFLARMIQMNMVLPAVVFDQLDGFVVDGMYSPAAWSKLPGLTLDRLGQSTSGSPAVKFHMTAIFAHIWELLLAVDCGEDGKGQYLFDFATARFILDGEWPWHETLPDMSKPETAMVRACQVSLRILRYLLDDRLLPPQRTEQLVAMVEEMKSHITTTDSATWLWYAPHANLWVTTLGLAVSEDVQGRLWFLMHERCVVMSMKATQPAPHEMVWACYRWLRQLIRARATVLSAPV